MCFEDDGKGHEAVRGILACFELIHRHLGHCGDDACRYKLKTLLGHKTSWEEKWMLLKDLQVEYGIYEP